MSFSKRKICAVVVAIFGGGAIALQWLDSGPNVVAKYGRLLPVWVQDPKFIGIAVTAIVTGLVIMLILAPWRGKEPAQASTIQTPDDPRFIIEAAIMRRMDHSISRLEGVDDVADRNVRAMHCVDHDIPVFLQTILGSKEKDKYTQAIDSARSDAEPIRLFRVAMTYLEGICVKRLHDKIARIDGGKGGSV
jgi:hypothetical protein